VLRRADLVAIAHSILGDPTILPCDHVVEFGSRVLQAAGILSNHEALSAFRASSSGERFVQEIHEVFHVVAAEAISELQADS